MDRKKFADLHAELGNKKTRLNKDRMIKMYQKYLPKFGEYDRNTKGFVFKTNTRKKFEKDYADYLRKQKKGR